MANYKKLGMDRATTAAQAAFGSGSGSVVTDDITRGSIVSVEFDGTTDSASSEVGGRRAGAIPIMVDLDDHTEFIWVIVGTTLTVTIGAAARTGTLYFWVF